MRSYSLDLRHRIVAAVQEGHSLKAVAERFCVSPVTVCRYRNQHQQTQNLSPKRPTGAPHRLDESALTALLQRVREQPDQTITELHDWLTKEKRTTVSRATVHRAL